MSYKPKTIYLIRHAESTYNAYMHSCWNWLTLRCCFDPRIYDPLLSPRGEAQAKSLHQKLHKENFFSKLDLVVTSPLQRSIQTTLFAFPRTSFVPTSFPTPRSLTSDSKSVPALKEPLLPDQSTSRPDSPEPIDLDELKTPRSEQTFSKPGTTYSTFPGSGAEKSTEDSKSEERGESEKDIDTKGARGEDKHATTVKISPSTPESIPIMIQPLLSEIGDTCGDIGSSVEELKKKYPMLDFSTVTDNWWYYDQAEGPRVSIDEPVSHVDERIKGLTAFLLSRPEENIAVVGHSQFFKRWTRGWKMKNCGIVKLYLDQHGALFKPSIVEK